MHIKAYLNIMDEAKKIMDDMAPIINTDDREYKRASAIYRLAFVGLVEDGISFTKSGHMLTIETDGVKYTMPISSETDKDVVKECPESGQRFQDIIRRVLEKNGFREEDYRDPENKPVNDIGNEPAGEPELLDDEEDEPAAELEEEREERGPAKTLGDDFDGPVNEEEESAPDYEEPEDVSKEEDFENNFEEDDSETDELKEKTAGHVEESIKTEPDGAQLPDHLAKDEFTFRFERFKIRENGADTTYSAMIIPLSLDDPEPDMIACVISGKGSTITRATNREDTGCVNIRIGDHSIRFSGRMSDGKFTVDLTKNPDRRENTPEWEIIRGPGKDYGENGKGHVCLTFEGGEIHLAPANFPKEDGPANFIYWIRTGDREKCGDTSKNRIVEADIGGGRKQITCRWENGIFYPQIRSIED